jgi:hypothetical protein
MRINTRDLEALIEELMKQNPDRDKVKMLMLKQGIPYIQDPVQQMNQILQIMNQKNLVKSLKQKEIEL